MFDINDKTRLEAAYIFFARNERRAGSGRE